MNPYTRIPDAVFEGLENCEITEDQYEVLSACYHWANRAAGYRVDSYSAERVCRLFGLDADNKTLLRFQRALRDLVERHIVRYDYHRGKERTYHVWVPDPENFERIGTPSENEVSLSQAVDVGRDAVRDVETADHLIITNQEGSKAVSPEREPLNPQRGLLPPAPSGGAQTPQGFLEPLTRKPLNAEQCQRFVGIVRDFDLKWQEHFGFDPDEECNTSKLLRDFSPWEIEVAYVASLGDRTRMSHTQMKSFFVRTARKWIENYREKQSDSSG